VSGGVESLRRAFLFRTFAFCAALLLGCTGVFRLAQHGRDGLVLGIFLAAAIFMVAVRMFSDIWAKSSVELLGFVRIPLGLGDERTSADRNVAQNVEEICGHLGHVTQGLYREHEQRRRLLAQVFHALGQPITALRCSLEVGLRMPRKAEEYRQRLEDGLEQAERMARLCSQFRRLAEAIDGDDQGKTCRIDESVSMAQEEITALAEMKGIQLSVVPPPAVMIPGDRERVSEAVFYMLEFSVDGAPPGSEVLVRSEIAGEGVVLSVKSKVSAAGTPVMFPSEMQFIEPEGNTSSNMFGLRIAEHIVTRVRGTLERELLADTQTIRATLPIVRVLNGRDVAEAVEAGG